jgi:hypothetical protein
MQHPDCDPVHPDAHGSCLIQRRRAILWQSDLILPVRGAFVGLSVSSL